ncbi:MAG: hypothetical protein H0V47_17125 [Chloroflexia bacterium]|nr:hypothetical protein [Chloroflexia bacterium]
MSDFEGKSKLGQAAMRAIESARPDLIAVSKALYDHPEPAFGEELAAQQLSDFLGSSGFEIERGLAGMPTAFKATRQRFDSEAMRKGLRHGHVAIIAEYDADDERGHTTGRHLVAGAALGSALGLAEALDGIYGSVTVIGCPAASTLEGKRALAAAGVFEPEDAALGARPASTGMGFQPTISNTGETYATARMQVRFNGPAGEAEARQRLATSAGAMARDVSEPGQAEVVLTEGGVEIDLRARTNPDLDGLIARVRELAGSAAAETGSTAGIEIIGGVPAFNVNRILARRMKTFGDNIGLKQNRIVKSEPSRASDWGNVSLITSTVEVAYPISEDDVQAGTDAFMQASVSQYAYDQMLSASMVVALTGLDLLGDMEFRGFAEGELIRTLKVQGVRRTPRRWLGVHPVQPKSSSNGQSSVSGSQAARKDRS